MITEALMCVGPDKLRRADDRAVAWEVAAEPVDYPTALATMKERAAAIARGEARERVAMPGAGCKRLYRARQSGWISRV